MQPFIGIGNLQGLSLAIYRLLLINILNVAAYGFFANEQVQCYSGVAHNSGMLMLQRYLKHKASSIPQNG